MLADGSTLTAEELAVLRRAQQGGRKISMASRTAVHLSTDATNQSGTELQLQPQQLASAYPHGASTTTLQLLGQIDALLKAPPTPPTWALLRVLSVLERHTSKQ